MKNVKYLFQITAAFLILFSLSIRANGANYVNEKFTPYRGESSIGKDNSNNRYTIQNILWNSAGKELYSNSSDTYEHETVFYNYDGSAYASSPLNGSSWSTDFPDPYLDTQALDGKNEYNITIGSFDPNLFNTNTWYKYQITLNATASNKSFYKINGQLGSSICELGPWCVLDNLQTSIMIPYKSPFTAPENVRSYRYEHDYNTDGKHYAANLKLGWWGAGVISSKLDKDYFSIEVPTAKTVNFILKMSQFTGGEDYDIKIYDSNMKLLTSSTNGNGKDEVFSKYLSSGTYYAEIFSFNGSNSVSNYNFIAY